MQATSVDNIHQTPREPKERWCRRCGASCTHMYCSPNCADKTQKFIRAYNRLYAKYRNFRKVGS